MSTTFRNTHSMTSSHQLIMLSVVIKANKSLAETFRQACTFKQNWFRPLTPLKRQLMQSLSAFSGDKPWSLCTLSWSVRCPSTFERCRMNHQFERRVLPLTSTTWGMDLNRLQTTVVYDWVSGPVVIGRYTQIWYFLILLSAVAL